MTKMRGKPRPFKAGKDVKEILHKNRLSAREYLGLCMTHFAKHWWKYALPVLILWIAQIWVRLDFNYTDSLPDHVFLTLKGDRNLQRGDYVAFTFPAEHRYSPYRKGAHFLKVVMGTPGDLVKVDGDGNVHIVYREEMNNPDTRISIPNGESEGHFMGKAKRLSKRGYPLEAFPGGVVPPGKIYVYAPHPDSLDSRYAMLGFVSIEAVVMGKSFPIF